MDSLFHVLWIGNIIKTLFVDAMQCKGGSRRHFPLLRFIWDVGIIFGLNFFSYKIHVVVCGRKTHLKRKDMHKVKSSPKIDLHFGRHHHILLKEKVLQETFPCCHYDHSGFSCMSIGLASAPMVSPSYMSRAYKKVIDNLVLVPFDYIMVHGRLLEKHFISL